MKIVKDFSCNFMGHRVKFWEMKEKAANFQQVRINPQNSQRLDAYIVNCGFNLSRSQAVDFLLEKALDKALEIQTDCQKALGKRK